MPDLTTVTGYEIRAEDKSGPATRSAREGLLSVHGAADGLRTKLGALGGLFSIGMFANAIKSAIDFADQLNDLAQKTGLSVETLGGLGYAAEQSGTDLDSVARATQKLAQNMAAAAGGNKEAQRVFDALGISVRNSDGSLKSLDSALFELADKFAGYEDGAGKAALATEVMGKAGAGAIPFLNQGGKALRELIAEYQRYGGISTDTAQRADAFNDTVGKLRLIFGALFKEIAAAVLPTLQALANWLVTLKGNGESFRVVTEGITVALKGLVVAGMVVVEAFRAVGKSIGTVLGAIMAYLRGDSMSTIWEGLKDGFADVGRSIADTARNAAAIWNAETVAIVHTTGAALERGRPPIVRFGEAVGRVGDEMHAHVEAYRAWLDETGKIRDALGATEKELEALNQHYAEFRRLQSGSADITRDFTNARNAVAGLAIAMEQEAELLALTGRARAARVFDLEAERHALHLNAEELAEYRERYLAAFDRREALTQAIAFYDDLRNATAGFLEDLLSNGDRAFRNLWESFKRWALQAFAQIAAQRIVVSLGANIGGPGGGLLGGGGLGGGLGDIAGLFGLGGSLSGGGLLGAGAGFGGGLTAALDSALINGGLSSLAGGTLTAGLGMLGTAMPWLAGAFALASAFGLFDRGGPKTEGSASSLANLSTGSIGLGGLGRLFTGGGEDANYQRLADSVATGYLQAARALGITQGTAAFSLGGAADPEGDAGSLVSAQAFVNGLLAYNVADIDVGRDQGALEARLDLEAKRVLFAALQASNLPDYLADLFAGIDATSATAQQIDGILASASALRVAVEAMAGLGDQFAAMDPSQVEAFVTAFGGVEGVLERFAFIADNFYTDAEKLAAATEDLQVGFAALGLSVPTTHAAFRDLLNSLDLTSEHGRALYEAISALAPLFVQVHGTAEDAARALDDASQSLADLNDAANALAATIIDLGSLSGTVYGEANASIARIIDLAGMLGGSIGEQLTAQINLASGEIQRYIALWQQAAPGSAESQALLEIIGILQQFNQGTAAALAQYTSIVAQYGADFADAIFRLQQQYWQQMQLFAGNTIALSNLAQWYNEQLQAILEGTEQGVTGTISELARLRESLRDYLKGLTLRADLSPLSPMARLAEARSQYEELLAAAAGGDVDALRQLQSAADAYLQLARQLYASGPEFSEIWQSVIDALSVIAEPPTTGGPEPRAEELLADALPLDSRLVSQDDLALAAERIVAAIQAGAHAQADAAARSAERVAVLTRPHK